MSISSRSDWADIGAKIHYTCLQIKNYFGLGLNNHDCVATGRISIFISYAQTDIDLAKTLKKMLSEYNFDVFLAADDIHGGDKWEYVLRDKIKNCDVFLPLLSQNYHQGNLPDQEFGIAHGCGDKILPIRLDQTKPYGFMTSYQYVDCDQSFPRDDIDIIAMDVLRCAGRHMHVIDWLIEMLDGIKPDGAAAWLLKLDKHFGLAEYQKNRIVHLYVKWATGRRDKITYADPELVRFFLYTFAARYTLIRA